MDWCQIDGPDGSRLSVTNPLPSFWFDSRLKQITFFDLFYRTECTVHLQDHKHSNTSCCNFDCQSTTTGK